jgi:serine/threonine protein kinase
MAGNNVVNYGTPADIVSFGVMTWEACSGETAWLETFGGGDQADDSIITAVRANGGSELPLLPASKCPAWLANLMLLCMDPTPTNRPTAPQIVVRVWVPSCLNETF